MKNPAFYLVIVSLFFLACIHSTAYAWEPEQMNLLFRQAETLFEQGQYSRSVTVFEQVLSLSPQNQLAQEYIARAKKEMLIRQKQDEIASKRERKEEFKRKKLERRLEAKEVKSQVRLDKLAKKGQEVQITAWQNFVKEKNIDTKSSVEKEIKKRMQEIRREEIKEQDRQKVWIRQQEQIRIKQELLKQKEEVAAKRIEMAEQKESQKRKQLEIITQEKAKVVTKVKIEDFSVKPQEQLKIKLKLPTY